jgi:hypothetical protein
MGAVPLPLGGLEANDIFHAHAGPANSNTTHPKAAVSWHPRAQLSLRVFTRHNFPPRSVAGNITGIPFGRLFKIGHFSKSFNVPALA